MVEGDATNDAATVDGRVTVDATTEDELCADAVDVEPGELAREPGLRKPPETTARRNSAVRGEAADMNAGDEAATGEGAADTEATITESADTAMAGGEPGDSEPGDGDSGEQVTDEPPPTGSLRGRLSRLLKSPALAVAALTLSVLGVAAAAISSAPDDRGGVRAVTTRLAGPLTHHRLPELVADLKPTGRKTHYVQVIAVVEVPEDAVPMLQEHEAPIIAAVQMRLRDSDRRTLVGAEGAERMRKEMISIIEGRIAPHRVHAVLFTRFLLD